MFGLDLKTTGKWFVFSIVVGVVAGTGAVVFQFACQLVSHYALEGVAGYTAVEPAGEASHFEHEPGVLSFPLLFCVLAAGGLVSGWLVYTFAPEAEGHGTDAAIDAFHRKRGYIAPRIRRTLSNSARDAHTAAHTSSASSRQNGRRRTASPSSTTSWSTTVSSLVMALLAAKGWRPAPASSRC